MFSKDDLDQIKAKEIEFGRIEDQLAHFRSGYPYIRLFKPAIPGDGIHTLNDEEKTFYIQLFDQTAPDIQIMKFVPASGAASRMFKHLFEFREKYHLSDQTGQDPNPDFNSVQYLLTNLKTIAFFPELQSLLANDGSDITELLQHREFGVIIDYILNGKGLNYSNLPKALISFHAYPAGARTSAEEHLVEAAHYTRDRHGISRIHFTISPEHHKKFKELFLRVVSKYELRYHVGFDISFSFQKSSTDTLAVDENNLPFRDQDGTLLFRPGGHGALLDNLNEIEADLVFIKNIDNIVPDRLKGPTYFYKKLIGGYLLSVQQTIFKFLKKADNHQIIDQDITEIKEFASERLNIEFTEPVSSMSSEKHLETIVTKLSRPIRVCGMVRNEGEPGGGPYWVENSKGQISLQIVESSQIDMSDPDQRSILNSSTHFNPVDLVCSIKDFKGKVFPLSKFVDRETGFISLKSSGGKILKAQELPGLWNGAMADWITVFLEVPIITFNPVKTVNDLLRKEHLPV